MQQEVPLLLHSCACLKHSRSPGSLKAHLGETKESAFSSRIPSPGHRSQCSLSTLKWKAGTQDFGYTFHCLPFTVTVTVVLRVTSEYVSGTGETHDFHNPGMTEFLKGNKTFLRPSESSSKVSSFKKMSIHPSHCI